MSEQPTEELLTKGNLKSIQAWDSLKGTLSVTFRRRVQTAGKIARSVNTSGSLRKRGK